MGPFERWARPRGMSNDREIRTWTPVMPEGAPDAPDQPPSSFDRTKAVTKPATVISQVEAALPEGFVHQFERDRRDKDPAPEGHDARHDAGWKVDQESNRRSQDESGASGRSQKPA